MVFILSIIFSAKILLKLLFSRSSVITFTSGESSSKLGSYLILFLMPSKLICSWLAIEFCINWNLLLAGDKNELLNLPDAITFGEIRDYLEGSIEPDSTSFSATD